MTQPRSARRPRVPAPVPRVRTVTASITSSSYTNVLSAVSLWKLANTYLPEAERFPEPPAMLSSLHRKVSGNLSRFMRGDLRQVLVAHITMILCTVVSKQEEVFGRDQGVEGGGPYLACSRTIFRPPTSLEQHAETHVKGFCQLSKTFETCGEAFHCFFVEGLLPIIFVRNKGGASVGTADMSKGIREFNVVVKRVFESIQHHYAHLPEFSGIQATDFWIHPRRSSNKETLEFQGNGRESYLLRNPQVVIACTNTIQLRPFHQPPTGAAAKLALAAGQPLLSFFEIFSGCRDATHAADANPYLPWVFDVSDLDQPASERDGGARMLPAVAALFDEDDSNRSATGNEAKETLLFKKVPGLRERLNELQRTSAAAEDLEEPADEAAAEGNDEADVLQGLFYKDFRGLRSCFALVVTYTATPTTALYAIGGGASEIDIHMVELVPGKSYIGYQTDHMAEMAPHLVRHVDIEELPNRVASMAFSLKDVYPTVFSDLGGFDIEHHDVPPPFKRTAAGTITLRQKDFEEMIDCPNGETIEAVIFKETAMEAVGLTKVRADAFWYADGNNVTHILRDMDERKADYPCGYRNVLYMTNFSKSERGKQNFVSTILGFQGASKCLSEGLVTIEFDHRYTRLTWLEGQVDEALLAEAVNELLCSEDELAVEWARACTWGTGATAASSTDGESEIDDSESMSEVGGDSTAHTLVSQSNINYAYSVLHGYMSKMRARPQTAGTPPFFLKMLAFVGEIGARGVRYKSHQHALVLTDMYFAFNVSVTTQVTAHGAAVIQSIGRLCTLVLDLDSTPNIKLWIPSNCKTFCDLWLDVMDALPALYAHKQPSETTEELIERLATMQPPPPEFARIFQHFAAPTGHNKKSVPLYARLDHRIGKAKALAEQLAMSTAAAGTAPQPIDIDDNSAEMREATCSQAVGIAIQRGDAARQADADDAEVGGDDDAAFGMHAVMGPPAVGGLPSVPQPKRVKVARPPKKATITAGKKRDRDALGINGEGYKWEAADRRNALDALQQLRALRSAHPQDGPRPSDEQMMAMFWLWFRYFIYAKGAARCGPGGHGLMTIVSRNNYAQSIRSLTDAHGRAIFTSLDCLPKANHQSERHRIRHLAAQYYAKRYGGSTGAIAMTVTQHPYFKEINNMTSHIMKMLEVFPPGDLAYFVWREPIPAGLPNDGASSSKAGPPALPYIREVHEISDDDE